MRGHLLLTALAALPILLLPVASAGDCYSDVVVTLGVGTTRFDMEQLFDGQDARDLREAVDVGAGNGDGRVDPDEVSRWNQAMSRSAPASLRGCVFPTGFFGPEDGGVGVGQDATIPHTMAFLDAAFDARGDASMTGDVTLRFTTTLESDVDGDAVDIVVVLEAMEGLSELIECLAPDAVETNYAQNSCGDQGNDPRDRMRRLAIRPAEDHAIVEDSIEPARARGAFDGRSVVLTEVVIDDDSDLADIRLRLQRAPEDPGSTLGLVAAAAGAGLVGVAALLRLERFRYRAWWLASVFGFTRIRRDEVLDHQRRSLILDAITADPGVHLGALRRELDLATGTLVHHLRVLQRAGMVQVRRRGNRVLFAPVGHREPLTPTPSELERRVLEAVREHPGLSQSELAERLHEARNTVAYHLRRLAAEGRLEVQRDGRRARHYPADRGHERPS